MNQNKSPNQINRRQLIKKVSLVTLGAAGAFASLGVEYQKPTMAKLMPLKKAAALANSQDGGSLPGGGG
jgi:hypothetical protein